MKLKNLWDKHASLWRDPNQVVGLHKELSEIDAKLLSFRERGDFFGLLGDLKVRLLVSREYEHLLLALGAKGTKPWVSYASLPHPSGIAVDKKKGKVYVASTRNPNQIFIFERLKGLLERIDLKDLARSRKEDVTALIPSRSMFFPGSLYIHDLAVIGSKLYANAVGHNAVVELKEEGRYSYVYWPKSVDRRGRPNTKANYLQLNSIAAGTSLKRSFFSASTDIMLSRRPGDIDFPVDKRGVIFSAAKDRPICRGLTRPHSARIYKGKLWVDNSGYGEMGFIQKETFKPVVRLNGWTRGLCFKNDVAFVGTSRVIPKFYRYAPGLNVAKSECGIHAVCLKSGKVMASILWPYGNQIFAIEEVDQDFTKGFLYDYLPKHRSEHGRHIFYTFHR